MGWHADAQILLRLLVAMVLASIIGWDRETRGKSAGARTNILVGLSAALFTSTGDLLIHHFKNVGVPVHLEPFRILQAIVIGVSFLGSGIIFVSHRKDEVHGLTTAASVWAITGVGIVVGLGFFALGAGVTAMIFIVLELVRRLEQWTGNRSDSDDKH